MPVSRTRTLLAGLSALLMACSAPAPQATVSSASPARPAPTATPRPEQSAPLGLLLLGVDEAVTPPAEPTPVGSGVGRPTPTPYATAESGWKYVTFTVAVDNHADVARLVGIGGPDPQHTNLADALLIARDGTRYKPFHSYSSFGLRTASARSLTSYPVLLRLPAGFRASAESYGALTTNVAQRSALTFRIPAGLSDYASLTIPPLSVGPRTGDDEVAKRLRGLLGAIQPLDLTGARPSAQTVAFPTAPAPVGIVGTGGSASVPGLVSVTFGGADLSDSTDFQARNKGWKVLSVALRYRNDDPSAAHTYAVSAWLFGDDGVAYSGDVPALGDFGRATVVPEPTIISAWDGRTAGPDQVGAGQEQETRRATFQVPATLHGGMLVLAGQVEGTFRVDLNN